jgi:hypothetical protein
MNFSPEWGVRIHKDLVIHGNEDILQLIPKGFDVYRNRVGMCGSTP